MRAHQPRVADSQTLSNKPTNKPADRGPDPVPKLQIVSQIVLLPITLTCALAMSSTSDPNNHEDISPADFVKKIRELGEQRDREDAARFAQLEQDIAKGREERAARRAGGFSVLPSTQLR